MSKENSIRTLKAHTSVELSEIVSKVSMISDQFTVARSLENRRIWEISYPLKKTNKPIHNGDVA